MPHRTADSLCVTFLKVLLLLLFFPVFTVSHCLSNGNGQHNFPYGFTASAAYTAAV